MPLDITFTLSDRDLERFKAIIIKARSIASEQQGQADIEKAAYKIVEVAMNSDLPDFIAERLLQLKTLLKMMKDAEWNLSETDRKRILSAMSYFSDPIDLIPDHIPGIGFLDDAMFVEIIIRELRSEISAYGEFCRFRESEDDRLRSEGKDPAENREHWLGEKRDELHSKIEESRNTDDEEFLFHIL
ncbi:MAG: YkvA family protein [Pseudohongiellaceae bacterium]